MSYIFKSYRNAFNERLNDLDCFYETVGSDTMGDLVKSDENSYIAKVTVPGVKNSQLSIDATNEELTISKDDKKIRKITLSGLVDIEEITSKLDLGVLTITLPKKQVNKPKKIKIN